MRALQVSEQKKIIFKIMNPIFLFVPPAEATWAMITVLVVVIVVLIFCCLVPFYRALEKRYHHWEDEENDPRSEANE